MLIKIYKINYLIYDFSKLPYTLFRKYLVLDILISYIHIKVDGLGLCAASSFYNRYKYFDNFFSRENI